MTAIPTDLAPLDGVEADSSPDMGRNHPNDESEGAPDIAEAPRTSEDNSSLASETDRQVDDAIFRAMLERYRKKLNDQAQVNADFLHAARLGNIETLRNTQDKADADAKNEASETALHLACRFGHLEIVKELLKHEKHKVKIEAQDSDNWTPLLSACSEDHVGTLEILRALFDCSEKLDITVKSGWKYTALHLACGYSSPAVIGYLLEKNAAVDAQDKDGDTPLHLACRRNQVAGIKLLLQTGAGVNITNNYRSTPLTLACQWQPTEIVQLLLEAGADYNAKDADGDTPLILASRCGTAKMVKAILDYKPSDGKHEPVRWGDKNEKDKNALKYAMTNTGAREAIIPLLLNRGLRLDDDDASELFSGNSSEADPGSHSRNSVWLKIVQDMLKSHNPSLDKQLQETIEPIWKFASKEDKVSALLKTVEREHFLTLNELAKGLELSEEICELIWDCARFRDSDLIQIYCEAFMRWRDSETSKSGPIVSKTNYVPRSPLQMSAYYGEPDLVWYLLKESQSRDKGDARQALHIARARKPKSTVESKDSAKPQVNQHGDSQSDSSDHDKRSKRFERTIDILNNAGTWVRLASRLPERPKLADMKDKEDLLQKHYAAVVDFYEENGQIDLLRSSPSVFDLIYTENDGGINAIMKKAKSLSHEMTKRQPSFEMGVDERASPTTNEDNRPRLRWIHLPANNMDWMEHLTLRVYDEKENGKERKATFFDLAQRSQAELPTASSRIKFMKPICLRERDGELAKAKDQAIETTSEQEPGVEPVRLALYTPYVTFGYCFSKDAKAERKKHQDFLEKYQGRILHGPRSLDRFYYNALPPNEMNDRDMSQVVTRGLLKQKMSKSQPIQGPKWPYLTVDQLWVWVIDDETIITSSTHREDDFENLLMDQVWDNLLQASQKGFREQLPSTATEMSHFLVSTCVNFINSLTWDDVCLDKYDKFMEVSARKPILLLYADSINDVATKEKNFFKIFKERTADAEGASQKAVEKAQAMEAVQNRDSTPKLTKDEANDLNAKSSANLEKDRKDWEAIKNAAELLDEVKDIRDELVILRFLVTQQEHVWNGLLGPNSDIDEGRSPSFTAHELDAMIQMTDTIQKSIKDLLNLEENSINIKEAMMSRDLVDKSARQGQILINLTKSAEKQSASLVTLAERSDQQSRENARHEKILYAFTIVTVIFAPLSFMTSILALNTTVSRHNDDGELEWEPALMYSIIFGVSAICVAPFMAYALLEKLKLLMSPLSSFWDRIRSVDLGDVMNIGEDGTLGSRRGLASIAEEGRSVVHSVMTPTNP